MSSAPEEQPAADPCSVTVRVCGGFGDAFRVVAMLRTRSYRVTALELATSGETASQVRFAVDLDPVGAALLLARLHRLPVVLAAELSG